MGVTRMKHFTTEEWIDFVNQVASNTQRSAMRKHLETRCKRCEETVTLWQKVRKTAAAEPSYQPPADTVRAAKAAFAMTEWAAKRRKTSNLVELLFDSFLQPALAGTRSASTEMRQMLYRADPYQVDIQIEAKPNASSLVITGQVLNVSRPDFAANDIQVTLSNRRGSVVYAMTDRFGEFRGEIENSGDLELSFPRPERKPIIISLRNALDRLPRGKS